MRPRVATAATVLVHAALTTAVVACGDDGSTALTPTSRGIRILSGANVTDTVAAILSVPLIVEVHDSAGRVAPLATVVRFESVEPEPPESGEAYVTSLNSSVFGVFAAGMTDGAGRSGALVRFAYRPGTASIVIDVPTLGLRDTARFNIVPAAAAYIEFAPADTTVHPGESYALTATVRDSYGNRRDDDVTLHVARPEASITAGVVSATAVGRYAVVATAAGVTDTAAFSVIPHATIAAIWGDQLITVDLDGSSRHVRTAALNGGIGVHPAWMPGADLVVYSTYNGVIQELRTVDASGVSNPLIPAGTRFITHQAEPAPSAQGGWLYFSAFDQRCGIEEYCLERMKLDGTATIEFLGLYANPGGRSRFPSPSPDGSLVAYGALVGGRALLRVLDVAARTSRELGVDGVYPQWSPTGDRIAFRAIDGSLGVVKPDGSGARTVVAGPGYFIDEPFTWSPDGLWILYRAEGGFRLVHAETGEVIPLPRLSEFGAPSWR